MSAQVNKRGSESKYVSVFADSRPDVDVTFRDPLLTRPTSHYVVGVDNLTVCSKALSMIEPVTTANHTDLIRVVRKPRYQVGGGGNRGIDTYHGASNDEPTGDQEFAENVLGNTIPWVSLQQDLADAHIPSSRVITSIGQLMEELQTVASIVNSAMSSGKLQARTQGLEGADAVNNVDNTFLAYTPDTTAGAVESADNVRDHLQFRLARSGQIFIEATKAFWSVCAIEVPTVQNQFGFYSSTKENVGPFPESTGRRFFTVDPATGSQSWANVVMNRSTAEADPQVCAVNLLYHGNNVTTVLQGADVAGNNSFFNGAHASSKEKIAVTLRGHVLLGLDRRVAVELGTSLPIKDSPMIAHQQEFPDFVIGRWMFRADTVYRVNDKGEQSTYATDASATREYQNAQDRVVFHELMPQSKVQTLRVRLFARVRTFDDVFETYNVRCIELPTNAEDWWHGRLHFVSKD